MESGRETERERERRERVNKREIMTRPRPTGLSVLRSCTHCHGSESESCREREGERAYIRVSERERWKAERNERTRCSSVDDSSLPWGARATHTRPRVCVRARTLVCVARCAGNQQRRSTRPRSDPYIHRVVQPPVVYVYGCVYMRARGDQHVDLEPALSGSHRPHQHHSITRGTLWNHLPNHLVTSTQRNADCPPHAQFSRASPAVSSAAEGGGGRRGEGVEARSLSLSLSGPGRNESAGRRWG